jgi:hypothetical protein
MTQYANARTPSVVTSVRCNVKTIATLVLFAENKGEVVRSRGELLRLALEWFGLIIAKNYPDLEVTSAEVAIEVIKRSGLGDLLKKRGRNFKTLISELQHESLDEQGFDPAIPQKKHMEKDPEAHIASMASRIAMELEKTGEARNKKDAEEKLKLGEMTGNIPVEEDKNEE